MGMVMLLLILILSILVYPRVGGETEALAKALASQLRAPSLKQSSKCCDYVGRFCNRRKEKCSDFIKPKVLVRTCRCVTTLEYKVKVFLDKCFRAADKKIALRLEKELRRMVLRKLPLRTLGSEKTKYYHPGKQAGSGAQKPSSVNKYNFRLKSAGA